MVEQDGFLRPRQTAALTERQESAVATVCPGLGQRVVAGGRTDDTLWGPYVSAHTGWATDPEVRHTASSGGALSMLLVHLIESGTVDAIIQTGPDAKNPLGNTTVVSRSREDILFAAGSRYAPSAPLGQLDAALTSGLRYAFVGKPCDAAAMRALTEREDTWARAFPVILSFFCAGVPSLKGAEAVIRALGTDPREVARFRYRGMGWPGRATAVLTDGTERSMTYHESWGGILSKHVQHRCKICADGTGTAADIVCADAWETDATGYPLFEEREGVSLIVARTPQGAAILSDAASKGRIAAAPYDMAGLAATQPGQRERRRALLARLSALRLFGLPVPDYRGLKLREVAVQNTLTKNLKNFIGTARRAIKLARSSTQ